VFVDMCTVDKNHFGVSLMYVDPVFTKIGLCVKNYFDVFVTTDLHHSLFDLEITPPFTRVRRTFYDVP